MLLVTQTSNHNWKPRYFFVSGPWEFGSSIPSSIFEPRIPRKWGKVTMAARADPGLSVQHGKRVKALQDQGAHGMFVKFEHLLSPQYLSGTSLGGSPLIDFGKNFYFKSNL